MQRGIEIPSMVVICLKFTTLVVVATVERFARSTSKCCDLLKIYYLCGSSNSARKIGKHVDFVVICLKFTTFVVVATVRAVLLIGVSVL